MVRPAVVIHRIGPYHRARLAALAKSVPAVLALEICQEDVTYQWEHQATGDQFDRITLFQHESDITAPSLQAAVAKALDDWRPSIVAVPGWGDAAALFVLDWAHRSGVPAVIMSDSRADDAPRNRLAEAVKQVVVRSVAGGLVAGQGHADYLKALGMDPARIAKGYDVVDNDHFSKGAEAARRDPTLRARLGLPDRYWLSIGRMVPKKNLSTLIAAYAALRAKRSDTPDLLLVGDGPERAALQAEAGPGVHFRAFAAYEDVPTYMALAEGLILASSTEQWGLVVNEAMAAGCPVLVSSRAGAAELIRDGENGLLTAPDFAGLADGLERLLNADQIAIAKAARSDIALWGPDRFVAGLLSMSDARPLLPIKAKAISPILRRLATRIIGAGAGA